MSSTAGSARPTPTALRARCARTTGASRAASRVGRVMTATRALTTTASTRGERASARSVRATTTTRAPMTTAPPEPACSARTVAPGTRAIVGARATGTATVAATAGTTGVGFASR